MRVVHVCRVGWPHVGGMESVVSGLAAALVARGHEVRVVTLDRAITDGSALPEAVHAGATWVRLPRIGPRGWPFARHLSGAVQGADIVHVHGVDGLADQLLAGPRRAPIGVSTHGAFLHTARWGLLKPIWLRTATRWSLRRADAVWFTSEADREALSGAGLRGECVPDGVDVARFSRVARRPEAGRWIVPGRVDVHKGLDDLIVGLGALARRDARPFLVEIVGPDRVPGLREKLLGLARREGIGGRIRFVGEVDPDALLDALGRAELALFPSRHEGFGVAVVETMAAGVPVLVSAIPAHDALVRPGIDGIRVPFRDADAVADALIAARDNEPLDGREAAAPHAWERRVLDWERAYAALVAR